MSCVPVRAPACVGLNGNKFLLSATACHPLRITFLKTFLILRLYMYDLSVSHPQPQADRHVYMVVPDCG